jgi:hypothetical protein
LIYKVSGNCCDDAEVRAETDKPDDWELLDLSAERLHKMKKGKEAIWAEFHDKLKWYCKLDEKGQARLGSAFKHVFELIEFDPVNNPNGFSLLQLAHSARNGEGIAPITLHPLLLWQFKYSNGEFPDRQQQDEVLRWILFANGLADGKNATLNREVFNRVNKTGHFSLSEILDMAVSGGDQNKLHEALSFRWSEPRLTEDGRVESIDQNHCGLLAPFQVATLSAKRLLLSNWACSGVSDFVLMWNQREGLHKMYGKTEPRHIPALFRKGRPFDADHIVPRSRFEYNPSLVNAEKLLAGTKPFFKEGVELKVPYITERCFRLSLPHMHGNYRYWPKRLNRADHNASVAVKMPLEAIKNCLEGHPLSGSFEQANEDSPWIWSAIPIKDREKWVRLPPDDNAWDAELIESFIGLVLGREYSLYKNAYEFLTHRTVDNEFDYRGII